jgi:hypothetical protein
MLIWQILLSLLLQSQLWAFLFIKPSPIKSRAKAAAVAAVHHALPKATAVVNN